MKGNPCLFPMKERIYIESKLFVDLKYLAVFSFPFPMKGKLQGSKHEEKEKIQKSKVYKQGIM